MKLDGNVSICLYQSSFANGLVGTFKFWITENEFQADLVQIGEKYDFREADCSLFLRQWMHCPQIWQRKLLRI